MRVKISRQGVRLSLDCYQWVRGKILPVFNIFGPSGYTCPIVPYKFIYFLFREDAAQFFPHFFFLKK